MFILKQTSINNFFDMNKIRETFLDSQVEGMYGKHCKNASYLIFGEKHSFIRADHEIKPYYKSLMNKIE